MDTPLSIDLGRIAQDLQIRRVQVESVVQLLDEGNTVPFITRYRKERTGNLNELAIREIQVRVARLRELAERKQTILKAIEAQGKLNDDLAAAIRAADNPKRLEDLYLPYKPKKKTKASEAREKGLEPLALRIWNRDEELTDLNAAAGEFVNAEKGLETPEQVLEGVGHILAEAVSEIAIVREAVRRAVWKQGKLLTTKVESVAEGQGQDFRDYFNYSEPIGHVPPHRVLAINRGDKENVLKVKLDIPRHDLERAVLSQLPLDGHPHEETFRRAALDALDRLLLPSLEREVRRDLTEMAERHAVDVFARNLRSLLLQPPITGQVVLAIDPGFRTGCKVAVLDPFGNLLDHGVIHPHPPQNKRHEAKLYLKDLVGKHAVTVVAIGNGTACRETEELVAEIIAEGTRFSRGDDGTATEPPPAATEPSVETMEPSVAATETSAPAESEAAIPPTPEGATPPAEPEDASPVAVEEPKPSTNGPDTANDETPVEAMPPIMGGAPDDEPPPAEPQAETPAEATPVEATPAEATPIETVPPPSSAAEAATPEGEAQKAEAIASLEATANPAEAVSPTTDAVAADSPSIESVPPPSPSEEAEAVATAPPAPDFQRLPKAPKADQPRPPRPKQPPPPPAPHPADAQLARLAYVIVNEAGASVYSTSAVGREEFPEADATLRGTVSIGRRLQDPLAELVKIEPQNIGVGLYQHDVNPKQLKESLETVIESCVNFVGVDLNTASVPLLQHVSGLNALTARRVVERRQQQGPYTSRAQIQEVDGVGPVTFTQAAGFLKIRDGAHPFERTWVHPESYAVAEQALEKLGFTPDVILDKGRLPELHAKMNEADLPALAADLQVGVPTLDDIFQALARPERDPREDLPKPIFKTGVLKLEDLSPGMELKGTVLNVVDFGAFVDIGLKDSGLVHISQLANRYIKSPHDVVSVGDVVTVWVMGVDQDRKRVSLTMVKPGTERPRGGPGERERGGRRGQGQGPGPGQGEPRPAGERRGGGPPRGPRREAGAPSPGDGGAATGDAAGRAPARPVAGARVPGPPARAQGGGPGRGGPRPGPGGGRFERSQAARPAATIRPSKPAPPPPPLSKDALTGNVPLRSFGQLKQLFEARTREPDAEAPPEPEPAAPTSEPVPTPDATQGPEQAEPSPDPQPISDQSSN